MVDTLLYYLKSLKTSTFEEQIKNLEKIGEKYGQSSHIYRIIANFAFIEHLNELAAYCYEKLVLLEQDKQCLEIYERLGYLYYISNGFNLALGIAYLLKDFNYYPYYLKYLIQDLKELAQIYYKKGRLDMYFNCYKIILDFIPENLDIINQVFEILRNSNEIYFSSMINPKSLELITHYFPNYSHAYSSLAFIEFKNKNYSKAEALIQKFIETSKIDIQDYMHEVDNFDCSIFISEEYDKKRVDLVNRLFNPFKKLLSNRELWTLIENQKWALSIVDYDYFELLAIKSFNELFDSVENEGLLLETIKREELIQIFSADLMFLKHLDNIKEIETGLMSRFQFSSDPLAKSHHEFNRKPLHENYRYTSDFSFNILMYSIVLYTKEPEVSMTILKNLMVKSPKDALFQSLFIYVLYHFIINKPVNPNLCHLVLKELPDVPLGYLQMGFLESNKGNLEHAIEWIWQSIRVDPFNPKIWYVLSEFYNKTGNNKGQTLALFTVDYLMSNSTLNLLKKRLLISQNSLDLFFIDENIIKKKIDTYRSSNQPKSYINSLEELFLDKFIKDISNLNEFNNETAEQIPIDAESKDLEVDISNVLEFLQTIINMDEIDKTKIPFNKNAIKCLKESFESIENFEYYKQLDQKGQELDLLNPDLISNPKMKQILKSINRVEFIDCVSPQFTENAQIEKNSATVDQLYERIIEQLVCFLKVVHWNSLKFTNFKGLALSILIDTIKMYSNKTIWINPNVQFFKPLYQHYLAIARFLKDNLNSNEISKVANKIIEYTKEPLFLLIDILSNIDDEEYTNAMENINNLRLKYPHVRLLSALSLYIHMKISPSKIIVELFKILYKDLKEIPYVEELYRNIIEIELNNYQEKYDAISLFNLKESQWYLNDFIFSIRTMNIPKAIMDINKCMITDSESYNNMINYCFFHVFFGKPRYAIEFLISNLLLEKKPIESSLILSLIYMYENNYKNYFDLIELIISQMNSDLRPFLSYLLLMLGQKNNSISNSALTSYLSNFKLKAHLTDSLDKYYFVCMGLLNYLNKNYDEALSYLHMAGQIYEINYDILNIMMKNITGEIFIIKQQYLEASAIFSELIFDIETNFSKLDYSIMRQNKSYIIFDFLSALIAIKLVYSQIMTKNYYSAIKNAYALLDNPLFQADPEIICGLLSFSYYSLNKLGSALYYLTQKIKNLNSLAHLRLLILIYFELADYQKVYELSIKYLKNKKSDEFVLELFLRSIIELKKYNEGISYIVEIDSFPKNEILRYFKAVILYYNNSLEVAKQIFLDLVNVFPDSLNRTLLIEKTTAHELDDNTLFKTIPVEIDEDRYRNLANSEPSKFLMDIFEYQEDAIMSYYQMKNKSIADLIHLFLNIFNTDDEDTRVLIEEFELLAQKKQLQEEYQKHVCWETYLHPSKRIEHDEFDFWLFLLFEIYSLRTAVKEPLKFKAYLKRHVQSELELIERTNFVCFFKFLGICEYYLVFEPEQADSVILKFTHTYPDSYGLIGFIFLLTHGILDRCENTIILRSFEQFCEDPEGGTLLIRYLELHDIITTLYHAVQKSFINESIKLIFNFIEFFYVVHYSKSNIDYLASIVFQRIDHAKKCPEFSLIKDIISKAIQTNNLFNKYYQETPIMKEVIEKIYNA